MVKAVAWFGGTDKKRRQNWKWLRLKCRAAPLWEGQGWIVSGMSASECVRRQRDQTGDGSHTCPEKDQ